MANKNIEKAYFAGGCFWGVEHLLQNQEGVASTTAGYMGGKTENPNYEDVCHLDTGHAEAVEVTYYPTQTNFETLAKHFFEIHDPTQLNRQGPDIGDQYRSEIFYVNEGQKKIAEKLIARLRENGYDVVTKLSEAGPFWKAEEYHQKYYIKNGQEPYCHFQVRRFKD